MQAIAAEVNIMQEAALEYAARGWPVLPLEPRGKRPLREWGRGVHQATTDPETIRDWWTRWPDSNVGIAMPPGMIGVDLDGPEGRANCEAMPVTPIVETGRGFHLYLKAPEGVTVRNGVGLLPGIDLRAVGGYLVAPPSIHASGTAYSWALSPDDTPLAECPDWIADLLCERERPQRATRSSRLSTSPDEHIPEGRRNATLTRFGGQLRDVGLGYEDIRDTLLTANARRCDPPLPEGEVRTIARSLVNYPAGPVRIDRRIANADLKDGPRLLAMMLQAGVEDHDLADLAGVTERTLDRWWDDLREAELETVARTRPTRRYIEVPRGMIFDADLSPAEKVTALAIGAYMKDGAAQVGQEKLADRRDRERARVSNDVTALEAAGYLMVSRVLYCKAQGRRDRPNRYRWRDAELQARDSEMAREAPAEAREEESMTQKARIRARGHQEHVTSESHSGAAEDVPCSTPEGSTPKPSAKLDGGAKAPSAVPDAPDLPEITPEMQRLATGAGVAISHVQRLVLTHGIEAVTEAFTGGGRLWI